MKLQEDSLVNVHRGLFRENFLRREQSGRGLQTDVGGVMGREWGGGGGKLRHCLGALSLQEGEKMDKQVDLQVLLPEQARNNMFVLAKGADVVESEMVRKNGMKGVRLVIRGVREGQGEASRTVATRDR